MKTSDFKFTMTSSQLKENITKQFGVKVNLEQYNREQLEDMRNKLRTRIFQQEGVAGINDLLTNETYQKDKAMLELLNTRIKEMLGEDIRKLKNKLQQLDEAKKGVKAAKHPQGSKGAKASRDWDKDGRIETPKDEVWGSRAAAAAKAGKPFQETVKDKVCGKCGEKHTGKCDATVEEGFDDMMKDVEARGKKEKQEKGTGKFDAKKTNTGTKYTRKPETFDDGGKDKDMKKAEKKATESVVAEKAESKAQQQAAGIALAAKRSGKAPKKGTASAEMSKMPAKELEKFAKTKHKGLPAKKKADESIYRRHVKIVNESLNYLLQEDEEEKAAAITAAGDMANDFTSWMQRVGQYQTKVMIELSDEIRHNFGTAEAEAFKQTVSPALAATLETLTSQREVISSAIAQLAGGQIPEPMGATPAPEMPMEPSPEPAVPDTMNTGGDEFAASDAASGTGATGRELRENTFQRKLAESHSIISKLAK